MIAHVTIEKLRAWAENWDALLTLTSTVAVAIFTGVLVGVSVWQQQLARDALNEARRANEIAHVALRHEQAPFVIAVEWNIQNARVERPSVAKGEEVHLGRIGVVVENSGDSPAIGASGLFRGDLMPGDSDYPEFEYLERKEPPSQTTIPPGGQQTFWVDIDLTCGAPECSTHDINVRNGVVFGFVGYQDRFGARYCMTSCVRLEVASRAGGPWMCDRYNDWFELEPGEVCPPSPSQQE